MNVKVTTKKPSDPQTTVFPKIFVYAADSDNPLTVCFLSEQKGVVLNPGDSVGWKHFDINNTFTSCLRDELWRPLGPGEQVILENY